ncbi:bifunctional proline dehydrogenase/L-glutamate gamma-semialdehyde dehydrogenase PutA [Azohydromonas australica]|uniref:bifunctional proline dehydrogenase/L-glutamate gamma-semialdehyde dehydrogenase PutA n=1 Tax=Azohydromonas australica TaxID=364039 RepID=UPI0012EB0FFB|nr:bifunctional proline dehydrogenase/L-glutamate gamma-semialdehyde dehydrogenase PutA [Azohydromonas australica]
MYTENYAVGPSADLLSTLRARIDAADLVDEATAVAALMKEAALQPAQLSTTQALAARLAQGVRKSRLDAGGIDLLTQEFSLDSREGVALMCLAEAMLRVPDTETRNKLIRDKIVDQDWRAHAGNSPSLFVNATAWGLFVTGKLLKKPDEQALAAALSNVLRKGGEGVVRAGVAYAMRLLGKQFVTGQTIEEAIAEARSREKRGYRYSYDMLGEGALTPEDADAYYEAYLHTIEEIGKTAKGQGPIEGPGVSVKLTGLHPRYEVSQHGRVIEEMYPRLLKLACAARRYDIGFHLDQEESARFPLTLEMLQRLAHAPELQGWSGLGISLQAYQKRGRAVVDWLIELGRSTQRRILVRLVKGAYWDTEIKRCQAEGTANYPVFTRKVHSDVSYLACAKALLAAQDAIFPQFATHNAFSIAAVHTLAGDKAYEFQCLHGMGESIYDQIVGPSNLGRACRIYAPVGPHATLLAYLVRRLLENGANTSFVNQVVDTDVRIEDIVADPVAKAAQTRGQPNPGIPLPPHLPSWRKGSAVVALSDRAALQAEYRRLMESRPAIEPLCAFASSAAAQQPVVVLNPAARNEQVGTYTSSGVADVAQALRTSQEGQKAWGSRSLSERMQMITAAAQAMESSAARLGALLVLECGKTPAEAAEEIRRVTDLCRLYVAQAATDPTVTAAKSLGTVAVVTSSSAPLYTLAGQIAAALLAGNAVVAKPSSHASLVAHEAVKAFHAAGVPANALQLLLGAGGTVGAALVRDPGVAAVLFTGTPKTAADIREAVSTLPHAPALMANTGGFNAMIVDSSALPEQVISDAVFGAYDCAGQKGASLKLLCLQDSVADKIIGMLGAMLLERSVGDPREPDTDVGPVATQAIQDQADAYLARMEAKGLRVIRTTRHHGSTQGLYVQPAIVDVGDMQALAQIDQNVRGPILHVVRWKAHELEALLAQLNTQADVATLGLHTRINETTGQVLTQSTAEAIFVNRAIHTARVGMQVEGGMGHAGTGPSISGSLFLSRLVQPLHVLATSNEGPFAPRRNLSSAKFMEYPVAKGESLEERNQHLRRTIEQRATLLRRLAAGTAAARPGLLPAPQQAQLDALQSVAQQCLPRGLPALSGEENTLEYLPRGAALCMGPTMDDFVAQAMTAVAVGASVMLPRTGETSVLAQVLGAEQCTLFDAMRESLSSPLKPAAVLSAYSGEQAQALRKRVAASWPLAFVELVTRGPDGLYDWTRLVRERMTSINVSAAGGSEALMMVSDLDE